MTRTSDYATLKDLKSTKKEILSQVKIMLDKLKLKTKVKRKEKKAITKVKF